MSILPTPIADYTDQDFDAMRARAFNLVASAFPDWTDTAVANFGNILIELMAFFGDNASFLVNNAVRESRLTQATQRRSVVALAKLIGYVPTGATAATTTVTLSVPTATLPAGSGGTGVPIPAGSILRTLAVVDPVLFQTLADVTIPAGGTSVDVGVEHSTSYTESFQATGLANQEITLGRFPFLDGSLVLSAANGAYTKVNNFLASVASDRHFTVAVDDRDRAHVRFGNGTSGQLPSGTISAAYKTGGGALGNVDSNTLKRIDGTYYDSVVTPVVVSVSQPSAASGGAPRQSRQSIQRLAPGASTVLRSAISTPDFEIVALRTPGVARALFVNTDRLASIPDNTGRLYIVPAGGGVASSALIAAVTAQFYGVTPGVTPPAYPTMTTFKVLVQSASYLDFNIQATVYFRQGANKSATAALIRSNLVSYFKLALADGTPNPTVDFGYNLSADSSGDFDGTFALSDIGNVIRDTVGVRKMGTSVNDLIVNNVHGDVPIAINQFPRLGTVVVVDGETQAVVA
jgi:hypothetical protein